MTICHISSCKIVVGVVATLSVILITFHGTPFHVTLLQIHQSSTSRPADLSPDPPEPADSHVAATEQPASGPSCKCSLKSWRGRDDVISSLNITLPWLNHTNTRENLRQRHPNLPLELLSGTKNKRCSLLPTIFNIEWRNLHWQLATLKSKDNFFLYSAFFDPETDGNGSIRILGVSKSKSPALTWCQMWFRSDASPQSVRVTNIDYLDYQNKDNHRQMPYLLRCPLSPAIKEVPLAVSLTSKPCQQVANLLKVFGVREREVSAYRTRKVPENPTTLTKGWAAAVCGPALYYYDEDFSLRLVEWLELMRAQGFSQVFLYVTDVHPNITKVLRHYTNEGFVQVTDYTYPPPYMNIPSLRRLWVGVERNKMFAQENIYFTDCVLRHMHQYRFLVHMDPDEVPILPKHDNFTHLLDEVMAGIKGNPPPGYRLQWSYFFNNLEPSEEATDLPTYLWVLRHTGRQAQQFPHPTYGQVKSIYDTNAIRGVFSHGPLLCLTGRCNISNMKLLPPSMAFLGHFKHTCDGKCKNNTLHDLTLHKYREQVSGRVQKVLSSLQLL